MNNLGIVYRDGDRALLWSLPDEQATVSHLAAKSIFPGEFATLPEDKISVVKVFEIEGTQVSLCQVFTMALSRGLAKAVIPDLLRSEKGPEFVAMLRREVTTRST